MGIQNIYESTCQKYSCDADSLQESAKKQGGRTRLQYTKRDTLLSLMDLRGLSVSVADVLIIEVPEVRLLHLQASHAMSLIHYSHYR